MRIHVSFKERRRLEAVVFQQAVTDPAALERDHSRYNEVRDLIESRTARWEELADRA